MHGDVRLDRKAVVVTGAGRGLGAAYARAAARAGASVIINDLDEDLAVQLASAIVADGGSAVASGRDVTRWDDADELIEDCVRSFGRIDGLVNNAGVFRIGSPAELSEEDWRLTMEVNVLGTAFCGVHAARRMRSQGSGSIINVTSGSQAGEVNEAAYGASKGAVASMTYAWAMDLRDCGITVNAISPMAETRMAEATKQYFVERGLQPWLTIAPDPDAVAPAVVYLLSDAAREITGQVLRFNGTDLSLMTHPSIAQPVVSGDGWTAGDIDRVMHEIFADRLAPLGLRHEP